MVKAAGQLLEAGENNLYMMRYMNRRKNTLGILPLLATVLLSAASCTESVVQDMET